MQETYNNKQPKNYDGEIDLQELFNILLQNKGFIFSVTSFISVVAIIYSLLLPNIYESRALLAPVNSSSSISGALGSYSNLAGLAGINLPSGGDESNSEQAIKKLSSLSFFENNILTNIFLPDLMAFKSWKPGTNVHLYDENIYTPTNDTWVRDYSYPKKQIPSAQESFEVFTDKNLTIGVDNNSGFITLSIKHQSPFVAKEWVELIVNEVNNFYRQKDKSESEKAVSYLNQQIAMTGLSEIKQVIAELMQEETQKLMLIEANEAYVFEYIDPPAVMEKKSAPSRALIFILSTIFGGFLSILIVFIKSYVKKTV